LRDPPHQVRSIVPRDGWSHNNKHF
jgi:hypothetical protein